VEFKTKLKNKIPSKIFGAAISTLLLLLAILSHNHAARCR
jgi:hypothetical protein